MEDSIRISKQALTRRNLIIAIFINQFPAARLFPSNQEEMLVPPNPFTHLYL